MQLVINSKFRPFTYDELIKPMLQYKEAYDKAEADYSNLAAQTEQWKDIANQTQSPKAYAMYSKYANDLEKATDDFSRGMTIQNRSQLLNMKKRYVGEIKPIEEAATRRKALAEEQRQLSLKDPTRLYQRNANEMSLDTFIDNPTADYGSSISGALLTSQVATGAAALAKEMQEQPRKWRNILGNSYYETVMQKGFSSKAVLEAIQNNPEAAPQLTQLVDNVVNTSGIKDWGTQETINKALGYARQGLWNAVGETQYQTLDNWKAKMAAQEDSQKRVAAYSARLNDPAPIVDDLRINPLNIYSNRELSAKEKEYNSNIKAFLQYFYKDKDGQWLMNHAGWKEYNRKQYIPGTPVTQDKFVDSDFKKFINGLGGKNVINSSRIGHNQRVNAGNLWKAYISNNPAKVTSKYDARKYTEYQYNVGDKEIIKEAILTAARNSGKLTEVDFDSKSNTWKATGSISLKDVDKNYTVSDIRMAKAGTTVMIKDGEGNTKRCLLPAGINSTAEDNIQNSINKAYMHAHAINTGQFTDAQGKLHNFSNDELLHKQQEYKTAVQNAYQYLSYLMSTNETKSQTFNLPGY